MQDYDSLVSPSILRSYLLGVLPEPELDDLETRLFGGNYLVEAVELAEDDLIDEYLSGALPDQDRERFKQRFLNSPERHRRVELARSLHAIFGAQIPAAQAAARGGWSVLNRVTRAALACAAAVILALAGLAGYFTIRFRNTAAIAEHRLREIEQRSRLAQADAARVAASASPEDHGSAAPLPPLATLAYVLAWGVPRGEQAQSITPEPGAASIRLVLQMEAAMSYPLYRMAIRNSTGTIVWRQEFRPASRAAVSAVAFDVPAGVFRSGAYRVALAGVDARGRSAMPDDYAFIVK